MNIATGVPTLDKLLGGGIPTAQLTLFYGEAGSGKSTLMMQLALSATSNSTKAIYVETSGAFPSERFKQIAGSQWKQISEQTPILELQEFEQQEKLVEVLPRYLGSTVKLVLWDTFTSLYRVALSTSKQNVLLNRLLNRELAFLLKTARERDVALVLAAQMRGIIPEDDVEDASQETEGPVAGNVLDYWTNTRIKFQKTPQLSLRRLTLERHSTVTSPSSLLLKVTERGLEDA